VRALAKPALARRGLCLSARVLCGIALGVGTWGVRYPRNTFRDGAVRKEGCRGANATGMPICTMYARHAPGALHGARFLLFVPSKTACCRPPSWQLTDREHSCRLTDSGWQLNRLHLLIN